MTEPLFAADTDAVEKGLQELRAIPGYPFSDEIDRPMVRRYVDDHPTKDIPFEIRKWAMWLTEHPEVTRPRKRKTNYRARLLNWIERPAHGIAAGRTRPTTSAARPEAYGTTSEALERW